MSSSMRAWAAVSMPSATTTQPKVRDRLSTPSTMARSCASDSMFCTKERSILSTWIGSRFR